MKQAVKTAGWALGKSLWDLGMQYGVWRRDIQLYTGFFPVEVMADQWAKEGGFPHECEVHDFLKESCEPNFRQYKHLKGRVTKQVPNEKRRTNGYSSRYYNKVINPLTST